MIEKPIDFLEKSIDSYEYFFVNFIWPVLNPGTKLSYSPAISFMCELAQSFYEGNHRLCTLSIPPRNTKTTIFTIGLSTWIWLIDPYQDILTCSAADEVLKDFHQNRLAIYEHKDYLKFQKLLYPKSDLSWPVKGQFTSTNAHGGTHHQWKSTKSRIGLGYHFGIIDDPISNSDADSRSYCDRIYRETVKGHLTRRHNKDLGKESPTMIVQQRVARSDLIGRFQDKSGWEHFSLSAIATENKTFIMPLSGKEWIRNVGDVLNPDRESLETLLSIREIDFTLFQTQYQQSPEEDTSQAVVTQDQIQYYRKRQDSYEKIILSLDSASSVKKGSANWGFIVLGKYGENYDVLFAHAKKYNYPDGKAMFLKLAEEFDIDEGLIEDKSTGISLIPELHLMELKDLVDFKVTVATPGKVSKEDRFRCSVPFMVSKCRFPKLTDLPADVWSMLIIKELLNFPNSETLDLADSLSQYFYKYYHKSKKQSKRKGLGRIYGVDNA